MRTQALLARKRGPGLAGSHRVAVGSEEIVAVGNCVNVAVVVVVLVVVWCWV
jgi:hypothetical protein